MSCQQASRFITTNNSNNIIISNISNTTTNANCKNLNNSNTLKGNLIARRVIQQEDPYVFTESVPTTPPILFNTQKTRTRLSDLITTCAGNLQQQKLPLTEANGKIIANLNQIKTQASFLSSTTTITTTNCCSLPTSKNNVNQSLTAATTATTTTTSTAITNNHSNSKKQANVCIVRPQLQTQQSHHQHYHHHHQNFVNSSTIYEGGLKSISPPPLYTPPTPSLWQTPLLLETTTPTNTKVTNVVTALKSLTTATSQNVTIMGCVTPTVQSVGSTTMTTMNSSLTTTAMAKVAPIIVHTPLASPPPLSLASTPNQCLPPSKFHNHTLAQHLQKLECLKKSIKSTETDNVFRNDKDNTITSPSKSPFPPATLSSKATSLNAINNLASADNHSENEDLNEIPVNVIFRMAVVPQANEEDSSSNLQNIKPQTEIDTKPQPPPQIILKAPPLLSPNTSQLKTNVNKKLSIPASKTTATKQCIKQQQQQQQQQIDTSSIPQQQQLIATKTTKILALNSQTHRMRNVADESTSKTPKASESSTKIGADAKRKITTHISSKSRKLNLSFSTHDNLDLSYNWQMGCSTAKGAVAIVKMSQHYVDLDTSHLATVTGLPYCVQKCWLNPYDIIKYPSDLLLKEKSGTSLSLAREDRIAMYRHQLRRQAMQLLSIRSLQKLPLKVAKRRLLCVDRLLRKYQQIEQNKKELPANVKRCCVNGCDAYTLEMASHCQQHIVCNAAQHVFLPCTAKFADNTQCRVPVFDITHDLPLCPEHARKRDAYNRLLYEQRPRKISTNPLLLNESITLTPKLSATNSNTELLPSGVLIKTQSNQNNKQKQQNQQHLLQQYPANNDSNSNKRPALINQQSRKRKMNVGLTANPVGRPQKRVKKTVEKAVGSLTAATITKQMPRLTSTCLKRKSSTTSLESIASNSQHSTTSSTSQQQHQYQRQQHHQQQQQLYQNTYSAMPATISSNISATSLAPPALAPLSGGGLVGHGLPQHLFSFGHDNNHSRNIPNKTQYHQNQHQHQLQHPIQHHAINLNEKHSFSVSTTSAATASTPTELKEFISQLSFNSQKQDPQFDSSTGDVNLLNTNSNSNFTSSGMGSTTSLPTADDFLTQDMLSICENSSASSADTGLGGLSDPELMLGGPDDDIPLGDTHLLEEHDLENVLNSLPEDAFKELFTTVHQDESDEIERAIELADKHLKTLQQTIGSELGDFLDFSDDMLMDNGDLCNGSTANTILDTSALFIGGGTVGSASIAVSASNGPQGGGADIRGLVQT